MKEKISQLFNFVKRNKFKLLPIFLLVIFLVPDLSFAGKNTTLNIVYIVIENMLSLINTIAMSIYKAAVQLFDNFLLVTLSSDLYNLDFVKMGWAVLRDFANVAFILGIIIIGFYMIIGRSEGSGGWKTMLLNIIIAAIAMNFSLFIGRVIIDMGNFTGGVFYRMTSVGDDSGTKQSGGQQNGSDYFEISKMILGEDVEPWYGKKSFGTALMMMVNINSIVAVVNKKVEDVINKTIESNKGKTITVKVGWWEDAWNYYFHNNTFRATDTDTGQATLSVNKYLEDYGIDKENLMNMMSLVGSIISIFLYFFVAKVFFVVAFTFLARTGLLIFALIKAPVYFAWSFMPGGDQAFKKWFTEIATKSFCIVVFLVGLWMLVIFVVQVSNTYGDDMVKKLTAANNGLGALFIVISIVFAKAALVLMPLKALATYTTDLCEGKGNSLGHKMWGSMMGTVGFLGSLVIPGTFAAKGFANWARNKKINFRGKRPPEKETQSDRAQNMHLTKIDESAYQQKPSEEKNEMTPRSRTITRSAPVKEIKNNSDRNILHLDEKELNKITKPKDEDTAKLADNIEAAIHTTKEDPNVKTAENIAAEKPKAIKRKGIFGQTVPEDYSPQRSKSQSTQTMMANLKEQATQTTQESGTASNILEGKQIVINTDNAKVDARGAVNMTGEKNNLAAEKAAQENKDQKSIEDIKNDTVNDKSEINKKINKDKDRFDYKLMGKSAAATFGAIGGGMFNLGKKAFDMADNQFASEDYLKQKEARQKKYAESNKKWADNQKEAGKAVSELSNAFKDAKEDLEIAEDIGTLKQKKDARNKVKRLERKLKDAKKKVDKAKTRSGQSLGKDIVDALKKAVVPEFTKIGKTISENQKSADELKKISKGIEGLNKREKRYEQEDVNDFRNNRRDKDEYY